MYLKQLSDAVNGFLGSVNGYLYDYLLVIILIAGGLVFTFFTKAVQFRTLPLQIKAVTEKPGKDGGISSFQALMVSTASRVGTGNIIGVSTAICCGGYGAVFWMWVIAIIGSASAFVESTLAQVYKRKGKEGCFGGPAYYIEQALKCRPLAIIFSIALIFTYGIGFNMLASFNLQDTFSSYSFYNKGITPWIIGAVVAGLVFLCLMGGGKRIAKTTGVIVPFMGLAYIGVAIVVVCFNYKMLPDIFSKIFDDAFNFKAIFGGLGGSCLMYGIKRGLFSNEAGVGSAPNASAAAEVSHPAKQGLVQVLSVFIDTLLVCSATAFMCLCSGVTPTKEIAGAAFVQQSMTATLGKFGPIFITVAMFFFAFTTLLGNLFYVDKAFDHLFGKTPSKDFILVYRVVACLLILLGAGLSADLLWNLSDLGMGVMALINIPVITILLPVALRTLKDYLKKRKHSKNPVFVAKDIGLTADLDCWQGE